MRLLMLDFDTRLVSAVTRALQQEGVEVVGVRSFEAARHHIERGGFDAALLDCDLLDPVELSAFSGVTVILSTSFLEPEGEHRFFRRARLLRKPFTSAELLSALYESCDGLRDGPQGIVDVLRQAHGDGLTFCLSLDGAEVYLDHGELVHAERGELVGESALAELLAQPMGALIREDKLPRARTIHRPFQPLMLELLRELEEREHAQRRGTSPERSVGTKQGDES